MSRVEWVKHIEQEVGSFARLTVLEHAKTCRKCAARRRTRRANRNARERHEAMTSLGLKRTPYGYE